MIELRHPAGYRTVWTTAPDDPVEDWRRVHAFVEAQREPRSTRLIAIYLTVCVIGLAGLLAYLTIS